MFPSIEGVDTPIGPCETVWATSDTHIGMSGTFTVNGVAIRTRLDLHYVNGEWQRGYVKDGGTEIDWSSRFHALMTDRADDFSPPDYKKKDVSASARGKIEAALVPWLAEYATGEGAEIVRAAGEDAQRAKIASARQKIEDLRAEIASAEAELERLTAETVL